MHDLHAHLYDPNWYPRKFQEAIALDFLKRKGQAFDAAAVEKTINQLNKALTDRDGSKTIKILNYAGIDKRVILILDFGVELGEAESSIDKIHDEILSVCQGSSGKLIGFAGLDPRRSNAPQILKRAILDLGAKGLKFHPTGGWGLLEKSTLKLVALATDYGLPVLCHVGKTVDILSAENAQPTPLIELAKLFPTTKFIAGHSGFQLWKEFIKQKDRIPNNLLFDISGWQELIIKDGDNIIEDIQALMAAFPKRVCFGSDNPFYSFNLPFAEKKWVTLTNRALSGSEQWVTFPELLANTTCSV